MVKRNWIDYLSYVSIGICSIGIIVVLCFFIPKADYDHNQAQISLPKPIPIMVVIESPPKIINSISVQVSTVYQTQDDFMVGNTLNYSIAFTSEKDNYFTKIIGINTTAFFFEPKTLSKFNISSFLNVTRYLNENDTFNLINEQTYFGANGTITPKFEGSQKMTLLLFSGNNIYDGYYELNPLPVSSALSKLQAETNRQLQNEIAETNYTNDLVLGLTIVIVLAIPIGLAIEYLIERHFNELEKQECKKD